MKKAVVLLSGGLDSTTCMSIAQKDGYSLYPLSFDYSQRHKIELEFAKKIANFYESKVHKIVRIDNFGGSALTDQKIDVQDYKESNDIPNTYVPARNIIFLSYALGYAEVIDADCIYIGVNALDYSGYPDCRPEFIKAFEEMAKKGLKRGAENPILIKTPIIDMSKKDIILIANKNKAPLHLTTSCYRGAEKACGKCDSCILRLKGFKEAGLVDPIKYKSEGKK